MKYLLEHQQTERLLFRSIQDTDSEQWLEFFKDPRSFTYWEEKQDSAEEECKKWYEKQFHRYTAGLGGMNALIEKSSGELVGHAGLLVQQVDQQEELEIAYSLLPKFWSKGYATEAAQHCKTFAFEKHWAESLISIISLANVPSQRVAYKNGMTVEKATTYRNIPVYIFRVFPSAAVKNV
jgi:[ribosomal protein S5]-alanine N-acetyltransferase